MDAAKLTRIAAPFDGDDWLFELKHDGFRAHLEELIPETQQTYAGVSWGAHPQQVEGSLH
ncbi:MAG TPA: hypothetical protein VOA64_08105 [Candidatus Dormibacteraeota bacterium]|nr:hypothetical protein [Candidatus Dormibacteraeota bacterium]